MKIFISADMEGISGVVNLSQVEPGTKDYDRFRKMMTQEVNTFVDAAFEFGATEVVVNDSHNTMDNILFEEFHPRATLISGNPKPFSMMQGIDETFDLVFFVGYHARAGTVDAIMDHTWTGRILSVKVNGKSLSEGGLNARLAGYFGVPVALVSGDDKTIGCLNQEINDFVPIIVKQSLGRYVAKLHSFDVIKSKIREGVKQVFEKCEAFRPTIETEPVQVEISFVNSSLAELPSLIPGVDRKDARTVAFTAPNYIEAYKLFRICVAVNSGIR